MLRNRFQTTLLSLLEKHFGKQNFKPLKNYIYRTSSNGFYVHAPKIKARNIKSTVKYVIRYSGKPAMAQSRISDKYFNIVRYYGLYAKKHKHSDKFIYMLKSHVASFRKQFGNWRCRIILNFKQDPLKCSCGHTFHFDYITNIGYNTS